ncbi:MAG: polysaccharide biosynthesis C-terminal domain-containing protein [Bacteroidetes bacterium]|nr:polysaccharide biosynthesis C-terminal domain-containing protein [Bacteroidota bacterium]
MKPLLFLNKYLKRGHERSVQIKKNIYLSFIIKGLSILVNLSLVPLTIDYVNAVQYGIWLTLSSIVSWLSFFDIGFGNGLRNKLTEALTLRKITLAKSYVSTTYAFIALMSLIVFVSVVLMNQFINWQKILNTSVIDEASLSNIALLIITFFCLQFLFQLINTIVISKQETAKASLFNLVSNSITLLIILIIRKQTVGNLYNLVIVTGSSIVFVLIIASIILFKGAYKNISPSIKYVKFKFINSLIGVGLKFFLIQIGAIVLFQTNNIIISQLFSPIEVTEYNVSFRYFNISLMIFSILIAPYWSAFTEAWTKKEFYWINSHLKKLIYIVALLSFLNIILLIFSDKIFSLWIGDAVKVRKSLSIIVAISVIFQMWQSIYINFLNGISKVKLQLILVIITSLLNIPLAYILGKTIGLSGVILSTVILYLIIGIVVYIQTKKIINNSATGIWNA